MSQARDEEIHLPDLWFINMCESRYGINRGIYNTIDAWFFRQGIKDILHRRQTILSFLEFMRSQSDRQGNARRKFGPGGLSVKLETYYSADASQVGSSERIKGWG
ncbi:hypothetical protein LOK74_23415 [Brevibacillus humidisoli]|uniref:hypothetical protein n=1 Tax=Brevibacillus humidisoli TaxID=2895522 RepID=UPI001E4540FD|nr:hypothetical protein [Brevibacillus humidisoli]UFJ40900.1 hypothetical protein LOK74_23415 [Brevibacillus humidisoli]